LQDDPPYDPNSIETKISLCIKEQKQIKAERWVLDGKVTCLLTGKKLLSFLRRYNTYIFQYIGFFCFDLSFFYLLGLFVTLVDNF